MSDAPPGSPPPPPASPPPPPAAPPVGDFLSQIPEAIRGEAAFKDIKDVGTLAASFINAQKLIGAPADQIIKLAAPDDAAAWGGIWNKLGRPESADKYALADPKEIPEGLTINPDSKTAFAAKAHELGLTQKQADAIYQQLNGNRIEGFTKAIGDIKAGIAARDTTLGAKWGDAAARNEGRINRLVDHLENQFTLGGKLRNAVDATGGEIGVALKQALAEVGGLMEEHNLIGKGGPADGAMTPAEASQQINALFADTAFTAQLNDKNAPGHKDAVDKITRLYQFQTPAAQAA